MIKTRAVPDDVLAVLAGASVQGNVLTLPPGQLDRKLYERVNEALTNLGGKWKTRVGHVFPNDPTQKLESLLATGEYVDLDLNGYFPTPQPLVVRLMDLAELEPGMAVLEPSAGRGAIAEPVQMVVGKGNVWCIDLLADNGLALISAGFPVMIGDFTEYRPDEIPVPLDRVVMNPPFAKQQDLDHVRHAFDFLRPGGRLVSVMASGVTFREDRKSRDFRAWATENSAGLLDEDWYERNEPDAFKASGTGVNTITVALDKPT